MKPTDEFDSGTEETDKCKIKTLQNLKDKATLISLPNNWLVWYCDNVTTFILSILREEYFS